jgi:hypothetical protein
MRADIREEWLKRLRSGRYQKGRHSLRASGRHCCLGVLCDIAVDQGVGRWEYRDGTFYYCLEGEANDSLPPEKLLRWAGYTRDRPSGPELSVTSRTGIIVMAPTTALGIPAASTCIHQVNDGDDYFLAHAFNEIADLIETQITPVPPVEPLDPVTTA